MKEKFMKAKYIKEFLSTQDVKWDGRYRKYNASNQVTVAWDANLEEDLKQTDLFLDMDGKAGKRILVIINDFFHIYDENEEVFEKDLTLEWKLYKDILAKQEKQKRQQDVIHDISVNN